MNLTKALIQKLEEKAANIKPSQRMDRSFPEDSAFLYPEFGKGFVFKRTNSNNRYSFTLIEKKPELNYWYCHARGYVNGIEEITELVVDWCDGNKSIQELTIKNSELEPFVPFTPKHEKESIEEAWVKVKNSTFNDAEFWKRIDWLKLNDQILENAKRMKEFQNYYPFTSHDCLRFSLDKDLTETWTLALIIQPSHDLTKGEFQVSYKEDWNEQPEYFNDVNQALNFLNRKMEEQKPTKWK